MRVHPTDEELLTSRDPEAFAVFYSRYVKGVEAYFAGRVDRQTAADLTSETFTSALLARRRFVARGTPAAGWLYTIAARRLVDYRRRTGLEVRALEALSFEADARRPPDVWSQHEATGFDTALLRHLPQEQRAAIVAHVIDEQDYRCIARATRATEDAIRQRVSRGLSALRRPLTVYRAAQELAREERSYRYGGGHRRTLTSIGPRDPLDCSASVSLILSRAGLFEPAVAWDSRRLADAWGSLGEGRYVTLWANEGHVWLEFKLAADHGERFDAEPSRLHPDRSALASRPAPDGEFLPRHWPGF